MTRRTYTISCDSHWCYYAALAEELVVFQLRRDFFPQHQSAQSGLFPGGKTQTLNDNLMGKCCFLPQNEGTPPQISFPLEQLVSGELESRAHPPVLLSLHNKDRIKTRLGNSFPGWLPAQQEPGWPTQRKPLATLSWLTQPCPLSLNQAQGHPDAIVPSQDSTRLGIEGTYGSPPSPPAREFVPLSQGDRSHP